MFPFHNSLFYAQAVEMGEMPNLLEYLKLSVVMVFCFYLCLQLGVRTFLVFKGF